MKSVNIDLPGYRMTNQLYAGSRTLVYQAIREVDQSPVVLKLLQEEYPTFGELVRFRNQYVISQNLALPGVVKPLALLRYRQGYALVMEDVGSISLSNYLKQLAADGDCSTPLAIADFLIIGLQLAQTLSELHRCRVIHKDLKPANILIQPQTKLVKLIDFSISSLLPRENQEIQNPNVIEGTLAYLSPEQTGRMNRGVDYRSDFYSLGVTFYELLTGQLPFAADDPMELVHCHIAKSPIPVAQVNPTVPMVVSEIVAKLMAKNAEERYQSALGLKHDLECCLLAWKETGTIAPFNLGQEDRCDRFLIPEKLYGRESQVQTLLEAFERVSEGTAELMLVAGFSGIGKTAVVNEVHKPIVRQRGYFIKGKYDQFNRNIPFSAFVQAFRDLMAQLVCESDTQLTQWKTNILAALGENAQVIIDVIPELEQIVGQQPPVTELSGSAAQNRFHLLFQKFIQVFTTIEHPLIMFLDDLQWADLASLKLVQVLMSQRDRSFMLLIGAYRDNEVSPAHPLMLTLDELRQASATVNTMTLAPLSQPSLNALVADTLQCAGEIAQPLTQLVYQKTKGNPFFTTQFLKALHEDGWIEFDGQSGHWQCDIANVRSLSLTDDVVEFMAMQLQKLPHATQNVLKLAACIGNQFDLNTLAIVSEQSHTETATVLWKALQDGLVLPINEVYKFYQQESFVNGHLSFVDGQKQMTVSYKFLHDRVQQAAYSLIPEEQKQVTHYQIGRLLQQATTVSEWDELLFAIVNHLNQGASLIGDEQEQQELVQLNLAAGHKAKSAIAYRVALDYFNTGISLLTSDQWQSQYNLALALHEGAVESAYLSTDFEQMEQLAEVALSHARSWLDRVNIYATKIQAGVAQNQILEALHLARFVLKPLGVDLPEQPTQADIGQSLQHTQALLDGRLIESLLELPEMTAPDKKAAMVILSSINSASYIAAPDLLPLIVFAQVDLSVQYGNAPESTYGYVNYGLILVATLGNIDAGYRFGQLGMNLLQRLHAPKLDAKTIFGFNVFLRHLQEPAKDTLNGFLQAYSSGLETGDLEHAALSLMCYSYTAYFSGQELSSLRQAMEDHRHVMQQLRQKAYLSVQSIYYQAVLNLLETIAEPDRLCSEHYDEDEMLQLHLEANQLVALYQVYFNKQILSYLFQRNEQALENARLAEQYLGAAAGLIHVPIFYFYDALVRLAVYPDVSETEQTIILERVAVNQEKLSAWAVHAPCNQAHRYALVTAERCRVLGDRAEASEHYDRAIALAKEHEYLNDEALANELAAKFYLDWGKARIAQEYMTQAYYSYARWGAKAKVVDLEQRYPRLLVPVLKQAATTLAISETIFATETKSSTQTSSSGSTSASVALDFASVLKASQTLSSEIQLNKLLCALLEIVTATAGADKCVLLLLNGNQLTVEAVAQVGQPATVLQSIPLHNSQEVPIRLVNGVRRTLQPAVIIEAACHPSLLADPYILQQQPKSVMCTPILHQGKLLGVLYLENNLTIGAFTSDRVELLNLLSIQAAISLENARLYQESQAYAQQLEQVLQDLQQTQLQMIQSEKMSALGNLVAGVAHEINNPVGFISGNLSEAQQTVQDLVEHLNLYRTQASATDIADHAQEIDVEYLISDLPKMIDSMKVGCTRIEGISTSLSTFSRADHNHQVTANLHEGIDSTILILKHRLKANESRPAIEVVTDYGNISPIECFPGQLNQVFMNILANAIDALEESNTGRGFKDIQAQPNRIIVKTEPSNDRQSVLIRIQDNGIGMTDDVKQKIFQHLFTTKGVGKGTGLGLAIARQIVVEKHSGTIKVNSTLGEGTEFVITLPVKPKSVVNRSQL